MNATATKNYYEILGVPKDADVEAVRSAYRKLAHKYHPDKTGGDAVAEEKIKEINEAYDVLKNAEKRKKYDAEQAMGQDFGFRGSHRGGTGFRAPFSDIFGDIFGGGAGFRTGPRAGVDLETSVVVTLNEVANGAKKTIRFSRAEHCADCNGSGSAKGAAKETCADCGGSGQRVHNQGFIRASVTCRKCQGQGTIITSPCAHCRGSGRTMVRREVQVTVPLGVESGARLRVTGEGELGDPGAPRGDLYVRIDVEDDPFFVRHGRHIHCQVPITFGQAVLGASIRVPTLEGVANLKAPAGTQNGAKLKLRGMGLPQLNGGRRGDEIVQILVEVPRKITKEQRKLIKQFETGVKPQDLPLIERFKRLLRKFRSGKTA